MLSEEATNTNFVVFWLTRSGLELTIYPRGEHANHYTTGAVYNRIGIDTICIYVCLQFGPHEPV